MCLCLKISDVKLSTALLNSSSVELIIFFSHVFSYVYLLSSGLKEKVFDWFWFFSVKWKKKMMWLMVQCIYDYSNIVKFYCKNLIWINLHVHVYEHNQCRDFLHNIPVFTKVYC